MSARSLNMVQLIGNLTRDPELRYTPNGTAVATIGLATNRSWAGQDGGARQEETTFHRIVVWSKLAEICGQYLKKGNKAYVQGRLQNRKWTTKEGQERETVEIVADQVIILTPGAGAAATQQSSDYAYPDQEKAAPADNAPQTQSAPSMDDVSDDIPF